jgi:hypothetical protein
MLLFDDLVPRASTGMTRRLGEMELEVTTLVASSARSSTAKARGTAEKEAKACQDRTERGVAKN